VNPAVKIVLLLAASVGAGIMNALAGGGTILTFPALLLAGESAIVANATSAVALLPGAAASMFGYRQAVLSHRWWLRTLLLPSLVGGAIGSLLLLATPERTFAHLAPWLILFATGLFILQSFVGRRNGTGESAESPESLECPKPASGLRFTFVVLFQLGVATYGGYFGAGIGILMLAALGFLGLRDIHAMNGLKNFFGMCINGVAAAIFIARGAVDWPHALLMTAGAVLGGYSGARFAVHIGKEKARGAVIVIGILVAAILLLQRR
jgi:hypothetical protein